MLILHGTADRALRAVKYAEERSAHISTGLAGSVYYSEAKYIQRGLKHAQLVSFDGIGHTWCVSQVVTTEAGGANRAP